MPSTIEWTDETWNPVTGCTKVSPGCKHCYAETLATRFWKDRPFTEVRCHPERLDQPLHWKRPRRVFVNSMSDLFHEDVPDEFIDRVFAVMTLSRQHTFQVLTKRPERMLAYMRMRFLRSPSIDSVACGELLGIEIGNFPIVWPLKNVWLGVSVEDQATADERIPLLLQTPAAVRFLSVEPMLGPIDIRGLYLATKNGGRYPFPQLGDEHRTRFIDLLDWVIVGGESGHRARACDLSWIRSIVQQCQDAGVPAFVKQLGARPFERAACLEGGFDPDDLESAMRRPIPPQMRGWTRITTETTTFYQREFKSRSRKGGVMSEWPEDLRVREFPVHNPAQPAKEEPR